MRHSRILRYNNSVYFNVTEWLASPGGTKFSKLIEQMSREELNVCLTCFYTSAQKKDGTYYIIPSLKFIEEPSLVVFFARRRTTNLHDIEFLKFSKTEGLEFAKTIIPFALVEYESVNTQLGATRLVSYLPSLIQQGQME